MADSAYGNDYSAVESADLQQQAARRAALEHSQALLQQSFQNLQRAHEEQDKLAYQYKALEDQKQQHARQLDVTSKYYDWLMKQDTPSQTRSYDFKFNAAAQDAAQGMIDSPDHAAKNYGLKPDDAQMMWERSQSIRPQMENDYGVAQHIADTLNKKNQLGDYITKSQQAVKDATHVFGNDTALDSSGKKYKIPDYENERIADWQAELSALPPINPNDKRVASLVTFNPDTGEYESVISRPHWLDKKAAATAPTKTGNSIPSGPNAETPPDDRPSATGTGRPMPDADVSDANAGPGLSREQRMSLTNPVAARRDWSRGGEGQPANTVGGRPIQAAIQRLRALRSASASSIKDMPAAGPMDSGQKVLIRTSDGQLWRLPVGQLPKVKERDPQAQVIAE